MMKFILALLTTLVVSMQDDSVAISDDLRDASRKWGGLFQNQSQGKLDLSVRSFL